MSVSVRALALLQKSRAGGWAVITEKMMFCRDKGYLYLSMQLHAKELLLTVNCYWFSCSENEGKNTFISSNSERSLE